jgi:hypothetical protein
LHIAALIYSEVDGERLFGYTERWNFNDLLAIYRKHYPAKTFAKGFDGLGKDCVVPPTARAEEVLKWVKWIGRERCCNEQVLVSVFAETYEQTRHVAVWQWKLC